MDLPAPFGKYELIERIATGGMAEVYLARSFGMAGFEKRLVIKRIREEIAQDPRFVQMFVNEAKVGVQLNHPNLVQVHDLGKVGPSWYIAMEHLHGRDLNRVKKALTAREERLPQPIAVSIIAEVCRGLGYAHARTDANGRVLGLVHRDISPHNLVVTFDGEVKVVDFGIARLMNTEQGRIEGLAPGKPGGGKYAYMSPEQADGQEVDHRSDIFSTGIVLWELIVGHRLFQDADPAVKLRKVREALVPHPSVEGVPCDEHLWAIVSRALARSREERYPTALHLEEDLRGWLAEGGHQVSRNDIAAALRAAFPEEADRLSVDVDVHQLIVDVEHLDAFTLHTPSHTPSSPGVRRLRTEDGERKRVAVLVIDVDGWTALSARVDPEVLFSHHYRLLRWLRRIVERYGGTMQRAMDDQIWVMFGVPRAHADDPIRALECGMEIARRLPEARRREASLEVAMGIHVGDVTVSTVAQRFRYEARGNTTRLARRLSALADHGEILVSEAMFQATSAEFRFTRSHDLPNRGGRPADPTWRVNARRSGVTLSGKGPWYRRGSELDVLRDALVGVANGRGRAVAIVGERGVGKSHLMREIAELAERRNIPTASVRCPWLAGGGAHADADSLPAEIARALLGIRPDAAEDEVADRVGTLPGLGLLPREIEAIEAALGRSRRRSDPDEAWRGLERVVASLARDGARILAFDDVQHLDDGTARRLRGFVERTVSLPVLILLGYRGMGDPRELDRTGRLGAPPGLAALVVLRGLSPPAVRRMLKSMLEVDDVDEAVVSRIERTCEGNPLYVVEMVTHLVRRGLLELSGGRARPTRRIDEPDLPDSLLGLVAARIDELEPASKGLLQIAAVIGPYFRPDVLASAAGVEDPSTLLSDLAAHGLVSVAGGEWAFSSELVRQATLRGILGIQKRDYHRLIAGAIESLPEGRSRWTEELARHCAEGARYLDAARYARDAGEVHESMHRLDRAKECYQHALEWIRQVPERGDTGDLRQQGEAMLSLRLGRTCRLLGDPKRAEKLIGVAVDIAADAGLPWVEVRGHLELGRCFLMRASFSRAAAHFNQARELVSLRDDPDILREVVEETAALAYAQERYDDAREGWMEALSLARTASGKTRAMLGIANIDLRLGRLDLAEPRIREVVAAARVTGDPLDLGKALNQLGLFLSASERYDEALVALREALTAREGAGYRRGVVVNHHNVGEVHLRRGDLSRANVAFSRSREVASQMGWEAGVAMSEMYLAWMDGIDAIPRIERCITVCEEHAEYPAAAVGRWLIARIYRDRGDEVSARREAEAALVEARQHAAGTVIRDLEVFLGR